MKAISPLRIRDVLAVPKRQEFYVNNPEKSKVTKVLVVKVTKSAVIKIKDESRMDILVLSTL